jgi:hypothetical protein
MSRCPTCNQYVYIPKEKKKIVRPMMKCIKVLKEDPLTEKYATVKWDFDGLHVLLEVFDDQIDGHPTIEVKDYRYRPEIDDDNPLGPKPIKTKFS